MAVGHFASDSNRIKSQPGDAAGDMHTDPPSLCAAGLQAWHYLIRVAPFNL